MRFAGLQEHMNCLVEATPRLWAEAINLGSARVSSNKHRDGANLEALRQSDVFGAAAELAFRQAILTCPGSCDPLGEMRKKLYDPRGGHVVGAHPDFEFYDEEGGSQFKIEIKSADCAPRKEYVLAGIGKWERSSTCPVYYVFGLAPYLARWIALSMLVPFREILVWKRFEKGNEENCKALLIGTFCKAHMWEGFNWETFRELERLSELEVLEMCPGVAFYKESLCK